MERLLMEVSQKGGESLLSTMKFAVLPIVKVFTMCLLGFLLASKYVNILPASGRKLLNGWFIPVNIIIATISGSIIGFIVASIVRPPYPYFKFTIIQIGIGNIGNIPLVLIAALCRDKSNPFGDSAKCNEDGNAYISFGQWVGAIILYTYVFQMLSPPPGGSFDVTEAEKLPLKSTPVNDAAAEQVPTVKSTPVNDAAPEQVPLLESQVHESTNVVTSKKRKILDLVYHIYEKLKIKQILQPPIIASILAIFIGVIPFLKHLILTDDAPLFFFTDSCIILGEAMIPCILLALGGNLVDGPGPGSSKIGLRTTAAIIFARLVLVPPTGLGYVMLADKLGFLPEGDKMFRFVLLLQHTMPTSVLSGAVASLRGCGKEAAAVLFWVHIFAVFSMAGWITLFLGILF